MQRRQRRRLETIAIGELLLACLLAFTLARSAHAQEVDVEFITGPPPSAESLANMLYPDQRRTRSIVLENEPVVPRAVGILIEFDFNSAEIKPQSRPYLDEIGRMLQLDRVANARLQVEGHADAIGTDSYNQQLSERRAAAVADYLVRTHDIEPSRLVVVGRGESQPLKGRAPTAPENRRVQFQATQ